MSNAGRHAVFFSALSTNLPLKKHVPQLEIVSEEEEATADEADGETLSGTFCGSPTYCTKATSSDEGSKLLLQQLKSSESPLWLDKEAKRKHYASMQVEPEMSVATEVSSTRFHKEWQSSTIVAPKSSANLKVKLSKAKFVPEVEISKSACQLDSSRTGADPQSAFTLPSHAKFDQCHPLVCSKKPNVLRRSFTFLSLVPRIWKKSVVAEDDRDSLQVSLSSSNVDDVNEMKALLNTINQNLKLLETRSRAHPQLLSSKLAPVYYTT